MKSRFFKNYRVRLCACITVFFVLVQVNAVSFARPSQEKPPQTAEVEGFLLADKSATDVNGFLARSPERDAFMTTITKHGMRPEGIRYISIFGNPKVEDNLLGKVARSLNTATAACEVDPVETVEIVIGGYEHLNGEREAVVMLVAHLKSGEQKFLAGLIANNEVLTKKTKPLAFGGDFFSSVSRTCAGGSFSDCVKDCMAAAGYVIGAEVLACIIAGLLGCTATGWFYALCVAGVAAACGLTGGVASLVGCALGCLIF